MNQNEIQKAIETNDLHLSIDLRVEQNIRLEAIAPIVRTLKERIGAIHASATIAYCEQSHPKYINLPVYITENAEARILNLFFPAQVKVTIWEENQEKPINFLEYHLDKRTEAVTEISGITDVNDNSNVIIISVDFTKTYDEYSKEVKTYATKYYQEGIIFKKPIFLRYIWKEDYSNPQVETYEYLVYGYRDSSRLEDIIFSSPFEIVEAENPTTHQVWTITISTDSNIADVSFRTYASNEIPDTFFLYENGSRSIVANDYDSKFGTHSWTKLLLKRPELIIRSFRI